ncbi:uncharacterized protein LOC116213229 isoform X2 [Punica granatum]|uniref:Uncharacterized protein LOC116213229 isoform X2 n=1 Tax=Punica granatum TaxID=22663 RepID=A0A218WE84_PUNGR|nr:uncharacterized protein LOC116213229 isoform X2 [Punica granatum]OWM70640.1 hypothetical protein CDL15_Pgr014313 [Punica granatum]
MCGRENNGVKKLSKQAVRLTLGLHFSRFVDLSWSTWEFKPSTSTLQIFTLRSFPPLTYLRPHHMSRNSASHLLFIAVTTPPLPSLVFMTKHGGKFTQMQLGETLRQQPLLV